MAKRWVIRRDADGMPESEALSCFIPEANEAASGLRTVAECVARLIRTGEACEHDGDKRLLTVDGEIVGFIEITRERPTQ